MLAFFKARPSVPTPTAPKSGRDRIAHGRASVAFAARLGFENVSRRYGDTLALDNRCVFGFFDNLARTLVCRIDNASGLAQAWTQRPIRAELPP